MNDSMSTPIPTIGVVVFRESDPSQVCLAEHLPGAKHRTGSWGLLSGKIEPGETPVEAAVREMREESGLIGKEEDMVFVKQFRASIEQKDGVKDFVWDVYWCRLYTGELRESDETKPHWIPIETIGALKGLLPNIKNALDTVLAVREEQRPMPKHPRISMIAAIARENRAIGKDNRLLWHIPEDFKHFKDTTSGHAIIMGENTFRSIGKPLPNRTNIVLSQATTFAPEGVVVVRSIDEALDAAKQFEAEEVFVCGGASIYRQFLPMADRLYLTLVEGDFEADTFFPDYSEFTKTVSEEKSGNGEYEFSFVVLEKNV